MRKEQFFKKAIEYRRYRDKSWILNAFSVNKPSEQDKIEEYSIHYVQTDNGQMDVHFYAEDGRVEIDDYQFDPDNPQPPFKFREPITVTRELIPNLETDEHRTSYGNLLANLILIVEPFGSKITYKEGRFSIKDIEKVIERRLTTTPEDGERDENAIYVDEYNKFRKAAGLIEGLSQLCVPSASKKTLTTHPDVPKRRQELIEQNKDRLDDPTIIAKIEAELKKLDQEHLQGDDSEGFFIKGKTLDPGRKKAHLMVGLEEAFGDPDTAALITNALSEGIDVEKLPAMINSLREGSFDRGHQTMLGGVVSKTVLRIMQNTKIIEDDCGSDLGIRVDIDQSNRDELVGNFIIEDGEVKELTDENIDRYLNTSVLLRTPLFCRTEGDDFCQTCIGRRYEGHERGLATAASSVGSTFMSIFMASAHAKALETTTYNPIEHLR